MDKEQDYQGQHSPCENCSIENTSTCCKAVIKYHDICSDCLEHCDNTCDECTEK